MKLIPQPAAMIVVRLASSKTVGIMAGISKLMFLICQRLEQLYLGKTLILTVIIRLCLYHILSVCQLGYYLCWSVQSCSLHSGDETYPPASSNDSSKIGKQQNSWYHGRDI
jgi:hypothetical protein